MYEDKLIKESILCVDVDVIYQNKTDQNINISIGSENDTKYNTQEDRRIDSFTLALGFKRGYLKILHYRYKDSTIIRKVCADLFGQERSRIASSIS